VDIPAEVEIPKEEVETPIESTDEKPADEQPPEEINNEEIIPATKEEITYHADTTAAESLIPVIKPEANNKKKHKK
jgi:hypothetical protein